MSEKLPLFNEIKVVTLCGTVRLGQEIWDEVAQALNLAGCAVFSVDVWGLYDHLHSSDGLSVKRLVDRIHKYKISISDEVYCFVKDGYIGDSTRSEIKYAKSLGLPVRKITVHENGWDIDMREEMEI